ncbi:MAG TPA: hypothetical protein VLD62_12385 [Acidimicrobiia bacterium]|nr:hypothetical protein [Acidimicrobiia bacterium]
MIRNRFAGLRSLRIVSWTAVAIGWVMAVIARLAIAAPQAAAPEPMTPEPPRQTVFVPASAATSATVPVMPGSGLVVIRHTPDPLPVPEPVIRRVVVERTVPAPAATPAPPPARSSGS